ncbi:hypothetical protein B7463_g7831, partial [Scytalidium lignicola]
MHTFLDNPSLKPENQVDSNVKHRAITQFELKNNKLYRLPDSHHSKPRYAVQDSEVFDIIVEEHIKLLHASRDKVWPVIEQQYYGIKRSDVEWVLKRRKTCALNRPSATKAPLEPIVSDRAWERIQVDLIDMRHEPSGQYKWIMHIKDHFTKYSQLYALKSKESKPISEAFAQFIMAFLPPKIVQCDNGREFKGALLILLRKYGIRVINGKPRSPQTQGLVEQANGVVEAKIRAWKMDNGSTEWADGLVEVTLAINTQKHSTIECTPVELLFRDRGTYIDWLDSQKRKDITIGVPQEDESQPPICVLSPEISPIITTQSDIPIDPQLHEDHSTVNINIQSQQRSQVTMRISPETSSEINVRITPSARNSPEEWFDAKTNIEFESSMVTTTTTTIQSSDPIIQKAQQSTQKARVKMMEKYSKRHDIQHFKTGDIVSIKIPREDRTTTDNRRLFGRILDEPHSHRYKVITQSGIISRLMPTKDLGVVDQSLWPHIIIPESTKQVTLTLAAREASTSQRIGISCQCKGQCNTKRCRCFKEGKECTVHCHKDEHDCGQLSSLVIRTEKALIEPSESSNSSSKRKRARADTIGNIVSLAGEGVAVDFD